MILDDLPGTANSSVDSTLDDLFRAAAARRPQAVALIDPPDRGRFTDGPKRRLTYAEADRIISGLAARLRRTGLQPDAVVGLQMANTVDGVLTFLGAIRAELIPMPLPLLWRRTDAIGAIRRAGASALVVSGRIGTTNYFDLAVNAAAEAFTVRQVCGFGPQPPDGAISLDGVYAVDEGAISAPNSPTTSCGRGAHVAAVTWDVTAGGQIPVARSHAQLIAGGLAVLLESGIPQDAMILSTIAPSSFAGIAMSLVPWLMVGGTLALHHPFDCPTFAEQLHEPDCGAVILPGPLVAPLKAAALFDGPQVPRCVVAAWRAPEQLRRAADWKNPAIALTDVQLFGEVGLIAARRGPSGRPLPIPLGPVLAPRSAEGGLPVAEVAAGPKGTLLLRGPMVPTAAFPPGAERTSLPCYRPAADGFVDTGYEGDLRQGGIAVVIIDPPPGLISFGGSRFAVAELKHTVNSLDRSATLAVRPDTLVGQRLTGTATDPESIRSALRGIGANPLLVAAFGTRAKLEPLLRPEPPVKVEEQRLIA